MRAPPPPRVARPVMHHQWRRVVFLHWRYPPEVVQAHVPAGLTVETFDGAAWVGLIPLLMDRVRLPGLPGLPWLSRFPETNVRTYVRDDRGRGGIWFFSLDAARLAAVVAARTTYRLPYFWSDMSSRVAADRWSYRCRRRQPASARPRCDAEVRVGAALTDREADELTHFLTARYRLFTVIAGRVAAAEAEHPPWPLRHARLTRLDQDLLQAAGLPAPTGTTVLHASPEAPVRIGAWHF